MAQRTWSSTVVEHHRLREDLAVVRLVGDVVPFLAASHAPFVAFALFLLYWPGLALFRRLRLRARRRQLIHAEWNVERAST